MNKTFADYIDESITVRNTKEVKNLEFPIESAIEKMSIALKLRHPMLVCGNGGSAADAMHIAGELVGRYLKERPAYKVIALSANPVVLTAWANDYDFSTVLSRQVEAYGEKGGVLLGISTSGNSQNVIEAMKVARDIGMTTIVLTGEGGGLCKSQADILIDVPSRSTPRIQEVHILIYHYLCQRVEEALTGE
jgi:D-sedoheptulose 7-phosphate isomerase